MSFQNVKLIQIKFFTPPDDLYILLGMCQLGIIEKRKAETGSSSIRVKSNQKIVKNGTIV